MPSRHFMIEGQYLGSAPAHARIIHENVSPPMGYVFVCGCCGEAWATCPVEGRRFMVWTRMCSKHWHDGTTLDDSDVPGSIYMPWEPEFIKEMPLAVMQHQLLRHLQWAAYRLDEPVASAAMALYNSLLK